MSSQAAAGPATREDAPVRESDRPLPVEHYGRSKLQAEQAVVRYRERLDVTIVRPSAVYGPRDRDFLRIFRQVARRVALHAAPQHHHFSLVYVADLVEALILAGTVPGAIGRTLFVGGPGGVTWRNLYDEVAAAAGTSPVQVQLPFSAVRLAARGADMVSILTGRPGLLNRNKAALARPRFWLCDDTLARELLGWQPTTSLHDGVRRTYLSYVEAGWLRPGNPAATEGTMGDSIA